MHASALAETAALLRSEPLVQALAAVGASADHEPDKERRGALHGCLEAVQRVLPSKP